MDRSSLHQLRITDELSKLLHKTHGVHAINEENPCYVTLEDLQRYWTKENMTQAFRNCRDHDNAPLEWHETIRHSFIRLFSLLVWIGHLETIHESFMHHKLDDASFPLHEFPKKWERTDFREDLFRKIYKEQWQFFPLIFDQRQLYDPELSPHHIIPVSKVEQIQSSDEVALDVIHVDPSCAVNVGPITLDPIRLVRKQYIGKDHHSAFRRERRAHEALRNHEYYNSKHIIRSFGSYSHIRSDNKKASILILEHANGGNLERFYTEITPPQNKRELLQFWTSFSGAFEGLYVAHQAHQESNTALHKPQIVHQDIKPSNLLLSRAPNSAPHDFTIKIADFGYSYTNDRAPVDGGNLGIADLGGGQTYGAPESTHYEQFTLHDMNKITSAVDVWSMGCVLSEACVWLVAGSRGLDLYEEHRTSEIRQHPKMMDAGHAGCFHDGYSRLKTVDKTHKKVREKLPEYDDVTPRILEMVEKGMLLPTDQARETVLQLHQQLQSFIDVARPRKKRSIDTISFLTLSDPDVHEAPSTRPNLNQAPPGPSLDVRRTAGPSSRLRRGTSRLHEQLTASRLSYTEAREFIRCTKHHMPLNPRVEAAFIALKDGLSHRDFIYFIDNSKSMKAHKNSAREALGIYAYITKLIDSNGIEASFASAPSTLRTYANSSSLLSAFDKQGWNQEMFEDRLSTFIDDHIIPRLPAPWKFGLFKPKRLSVIVLTDGQWGNDPQKACGVERPIEKLIKKMNESSVQASRTQVSFQFMRFGDNEDGKRHLNFLDLVGKGPNMDIVDTKRYDSDVRGMLVGSLNQENDADGEPQHPANGIMRSLPHVVQ
ncbi:protein kinase domain-containing protein [Sarocladium implicatum]|nr:protein kinase domain-containing protein [Sarocladium implicatum]